MVLHYNARIQIIMKDIYMSYIFNFKTQVCCFDLYFTKHHRIQISITSDHLFLYIDMCVSFCFSFGEKNVIMHQVVLVLLYLTREVLWGRLFPKG